MYAIIPSPSPILREATKTVDLPPEKLVKIIEQMCQTLVAQKEPEGIGLAANQVGFPYRLFLARFSTKKTEPVRVFINPEITEHSEELQPQDKKTPLEGCLSVPRYYGAVKRYKWVRLRYQRLSENSDNQKVRNSDESDLLKLRNPEFSELSEITETFTGFPAVVVQHEMDHLNGKIFVERILEQKGKLYKIAGKNKRGGEKWEEVEL